MWNPRGLSSRRSKAFKNDDALLQGLIGGDDCYKLDAIATSQGTDPRIHRDGPSYVDLKERSGVELDQALWTRTSCLIALAITWCQSIALFAAGIVLFQHPIPVWEGGSIAYGGIAFDFVSLALNAILTTLLDSIGHVHAVSLRWALQKEGRLDFNSNLRLLTSSTVSTPNSWYCNTIYLLATILAYASASLLFQRGNKATQTEASAAILQPAALILLGLSSFVLATLATWCYLGKDHTSQ